MQDYAGRRSETAFAELVRRHVDLVYSAALRMVRDAHLAEDVTQGVFVALAQNARQLTERPVLSGWLHRTAQNLAANAVRSDVRRRVREQEAAAMNELLSSAPDVSWEQIAPQLDAALGELSESDRDALLLRYFERKSAQQMAQILGISDDAAQKRVNRAVERLREFFTKQKITIGAGGLAVLISANAVQSAPVGLAAAISAAAVLAGTAVHTSTVIVATKAIAMTILQKTLVTATVAALAGAGIYEARQASQLGVQVQTLQQQQAPLAGQVRQLQRERDGATNRVAGLLAENEQLKSNSNENELLKLRGQTGVLQQQVKTTQSQSDADKATRSNFVNFAMSQDKEQMTNSTLKRLAGMKAKLGITPDQEQQIQSILLGSVESAAQTEMSRMTGSQSDADAKNQIAKLHVDQEAQITALLNPDQQAAYAEMKKEQAASSATSFANREASSMDNYLQLSPEQSQAVAMVLASLSAGQGGIGDASDANAKEQLEIRLQALAQTLTPEQLQMYRQKKLAEIEQAAAAMQMMKSLAK